MIPLFLLSVLGAHLYLTGNPIGIVLVLAGIGFGFYNVYRRERCLQKELVT